MSTRLLDSKGNEAFHDDEIIRFRTLEIADGCSAQKDGDPHNLVGFEVSLAANTTDDDRPEEELVARGCIAFIINEVLIPQYALENWLHDKFNHPIE